MFWSNVRLETFGVASTSSVLLACISLSFIPKLDLLPCGHTRVVLDDKMLWALSTRHMSLSEALLYLGQMFYQHPVHQ